MQIARVTEVHRTNFIITYDGKELLATVRGDFHADGNFPKVGDYVTFSSVDDEKVVIEEIQERTSVIKRKSSEDDEEQIIATNVDLVLIVMGMDGDFNISRLERYLLLAQQSSVRAVVILNKLDEVENPDQFKSAALEVVGDKSLLLVSALNGDGMEDLAAYITPDTTAVLLGSSGAGKSTITNWLLNEERQPVKEIRDTDSRGRHTTTARHLFALPAGGFLIDTPGMRELGVLESESDDEQIVFARIEEFAAKCKFRNCDHEKSAGCAVLEALSTGELTERELNNYHKLLREREFQESKDSNVASRYHAQNQKRLSQKHAAIQRQKLSRRV